MTKEQKKVKVLICERKDLIRIYLQDLFWMNGFEKSCDLSIVSNLDEADVVVANPETRPDVIFLGLSSSRKKIEERKAADLKYSAEFVRHIKADPDLQRIKVIMFSTQEEEELEKSAKGSDVEKYIYHAKNLPKDLVVVINDLIKEIQSK